MNTTATTLRKARFGTDATPGPYEGYTKGDDWNGWATPVFEYEETRRIAEDSSSLDDGTSLSYDEERDAFVYEDEASPDEPVVFEAKQITVDGEPKKVYPIGTYYWIWGKRTD